MLKSLRREINQVISQLKSNPDISADNQWLHALTRPEFLKSVEKALSDNDFTGKTLTEIFVKQSKDKKTVDDWHTGIYHYTLSKVFPKVAEVPKYKDLRQNAEIFLQCLNVIITLEKKYAKDSFISRFPFELLTNKEVESLENPTEYNIILDAFKNDYIYEMMKLNREILPYSTLEHITGVHYLAMFIARQVKKMGIPVDLGLVSGAAAIHDIGKFGCRKDEGHKVAYYHYYYTEVWCYNKQIEYIRNIAVNHSTWDLELESLSIESLILIYSDFRVKGHNDKSWPFPMKFYDIDDSFNVILEKLDNVDAAKTLRYKKVYQKLADFEAYLKYNGVNTNVFKGVKSQKTYPRAAYLTGEALIEAFKRQAFKYSLGAMHELRNEKSLDKLLNEVNQIKDAYQIRRFLNLIEQFSMYLTPNQKMRVLDSLYQQLLSRQEDLRRQSANVMGLIIASFDAPYSKYLPQHADMTMYHLSKSGVLNHYLKIFLDEHEKLSTRKQKHLGLALSELFKTVILHSDDVQKTIELLLGTIKKLSGDKRIYLIQTFIYLDYKEFSEKIKTNAARVLSELIENGTSLEQKLASYALSQFDKSQNYINQDSIQNLTIQQICLLNLKSSTDLPDKLYGLNYVKKSLYNKTDSAFYLAVHLTNVVKLSGEHQARSLAMSILIDAFEQLKAAERNEIVLDLITGLEIEDYQIAKNIPKLLGRLIIRLPDNEIDEVLDDFMQKTKTGSPLLKSVVTQTVGYSIRAWIANGIEDIDTHSMIKRSLSILLTSYIQRDENVHLTAFQILTHYVFDGDVNSKTKNFALFNLYFKKFMTIADRLPQHQQDDALSYAFGYNQLYRMLINYRYDIGEIASLNKIKKIAYFAGTFDPFSLAQYETAKQIAAMGYDVFLDIDNLKWKRRTQPILLRKRLIELTTAGALDIYMMPTLPTINLANSTGVDTLAKLFPKHPITIIIGEDVLVNSDIYTDKKSKVNGLHHLIIERNIGNSKMIAQRLANIKTFQTIKPDADNIKITSDKIRGFINNGWDLEGVVDPMAEALINQYDMYKNEPTYKSSLASRGVGIDLSAVFSYQKLTEKTFKIIHAHREIKHNFNELFIENSVEVKINKIYSSDVLHDSMQSLHTNLMVDLINQGYEYAIVKHPNKKHKQIVLTLLNGAGYTDLGNGYSVVNLDNPVVLMLDAQSMLKQNYRDNASVRAAIGVSRKILTEQISKRHQGKLVLTFDRSMLYQSIDCVMQDLNPPNKNGLGNKVCVPFGDIYRRWQLPNAITKALHIERVYDHSLDFFAILPKPNYQDISTQIEIIGAFKKPVILIDDLLDSALRLKVIEPHFKSQNVKANDIAIGILTAKGKLRAEQKGYAAHSGYFIPAISAWYSESHLYPFIGGDAHGEFYGENTLISSVNKMLPYMSDVKSHLSAKEYVEFSSACIHASLTIFNAIERSYLDEAQRILTLSRLSEVFITPRMPYYGRRIQLKSTAKPSDMLLNDQMRLRQIAKIM